MLDFNTVGEQQIVCSDGQRLIVFPQQSTGFIKRRLKEIDRRGLEFLAIALINHSIKYAYDWRSTLGNEHWLGFPLEMSKREKSREYKNKIHAILVPARERYYPLADFEVLRPFLLLDGPA